MLIIELPLPALRISAILVLSPSSGLRIRGFEKVIPEVLISYSSLLSSIFESISIENDDPDYIQKVIRMNLVGDEEKYMKLFQKKACPERSRRGDLEGFKKLIYHNSKNNSGSISFELFPPKKYFIKTKNKSACRPVPFFHNPPRF